MMNMGGKGGPQMMGMAGNPQMLMGKGGAAGPGGPGGCKGGVGMGGPMVGPAGMGPGMGGPMGMQGMQGMQAAAMAGMAGMVRPQMPGGGGAPQRPAGGVPPVAQPVPSATLTASALANAPPAVQKQMIGEKLFPAVARYQPELAGKITGMMLEMENSELLILLESEHQMKAKVDEAIRVLEQGGR
eukprot:NODE_14483_length_1106_cov_5.948927.p1 GENE.NODE_14483_length_1106_cov_5.948927~~NODE_14483_length_1106_cov_5.948927.p1  ORF type:complete len:208 (+),score=62.18 NODE_14483_length_1106_cov_5.948927:69-626(+)